ncbi:MAG: response regulator [Deltaproteobacteria bacterium]|jgi:putative two-component system response regulator|nr:response regulator [Deltaproteobacteria bacterium]
MTAILQPQDAHESASPVSQQSRVLIVDDAPENIRILVETLKDEYIIRFARNGEGALRIATESAPPPDIILLDVIMPGMDGYEVCRRLKENLRTHNIPIVFVTGQSEAVDEARGLSLGAVDYIGKPFKASLVKNRVANQLELKRHRDRLDELVRERTQELALTKEVTIEARATLAEGRDPETGGHIKRTQNSVRLLAEYRAENSKDALQLDKNTIELLYLSAPLHDVGKVSIPDSILLKPDRLTDEEFTEMKLHTVRGRDALAAAERKLGGNSFLRLAREIAYGHHERWDGKGYPQGVAGEAIPLPARLMSLADVYDALTSRRVYKPALPHDEVAAMIRQGRGGQFDPDVVDAFLQLQGAFQAIAQRFQDQEPHESVVTAVSGGL